MNAMAIWVFNLHYGLVLSFYYTEQKVGKWPMFMLFFLKSFRYSQCVFRVLKLYVTGTRWMKQILAGKHVILNVILFTKKSRLRAIPIQDLWIAQRSSISVPHIGVLPSSQIASK